MSSLIGEEAGFWLYAVALGVQLLLLYDLLRIFRRILPHKNFAIGIEDFFYWILCGCLIFRMLYRFNYGIIRWFAVFGMLAGMLFYHLTVSRLFVRKMTKWLSRIIGVVKRPLLWIFKKIHVILSIINKNIGKLTKNLKKKLKTDKKDCKMEIANNDRSGTVGKKQRRKKKTKTTEQANPH